jgi:hypothetical protein
MASYYYTDTNKFYNPFAMFAYSALNTPSTRPLFYFYDDEFDKLDWTIEPQESFELLMEIRAKQLREKYDRLVLFFSGGTDSITIYNTYKRLNIHLDEIVITYHADDNYGHTTKCVQWLKDNIYDSTTVITALSRDGYPVRYESFKDDFLVDNSFRYAVNTFNGTYESMCKIQELPRFKNNNSVIILGLEKPHIFFKDDAWYTSHLDKLFAPFLNIAATEWFFITPDLPQLHLKQTHLLKRYAQQFINPTSNWISSLFGDVNWQNLALIGKWTGRDDNISLNNLMTQKAFNKKDVRLLQDPETIGIQKFLNGLSAVEADKTILTYMKNNNLFPESNDISRYSGIYSKWYRI